MKIKFFAPLVIPLFLILVVVMLVGSLGGKKEEKGSDTNISIGLAPEVERYRPLVEKYCKEFEIPDKVDVILAIMMQESGGRVPDVMQSSESLNLPPNSITPEISIKQGVKYFASLLQQTDDLDTALQSYNFGGGFIGWLADKGGKYTPELASQFSDYMAQKMGWRGYGDKEYVPHVKRYLGNVNLGSEFANSVMDEAIKYQGYPYIFGGKAPNEFDCSSLTQWCYKVAGVNIPRTAQQQYDAMTIVNNEKEAQAGDLVFFKDTYPTSDYITHVGIYVGNGKMYHAGDPLGYAEISSYGNKLVGFGRATSK
ncbi:bifunctional lytic transglycosylase/C40 family peptidase [Isobaculum melis]|nr:lysozyme family protein [Isobaculum melis]